MASSQTAGQIFRRLNVAITAGENAAVKLEKPPEMYFPFLRSVHVQAADRQTVAFVLVQAGSLAEIVAAGHGAAPAKNAIRGAAATCGWITGRRLPAALMQRAAPYK